MAITGHRDVRMLLRYTHFCATSLAQKMGETLPPPAWEYVWRGRKRVVYLHPRNAAPDNQPDQPHIPPAADAEAAPLPRAVTSNCA